MSEAASCIDNDELLENMVRDRPHTRQKTIYPAQDPRFSLVLEAIVVPRVEHLGWRSLRRRLWGPKLLTTLWNDPTIALKTLRPTADRQQRFCAYLHAWSSWGFISMKHPFRLAPTQGRSMKPLQFMKNVGKSSRIVGAYIRLLQCFGMSISGFLPEVLFFWGSARSIEFSSSLLPRNGKERGNLK